MGAMTKTERRALARDVRGPVLVGTALGVAERGFEGLTPGELALLCVIQTRLRTQWPAARESDSVHPVKLTLGIVRKHCRFGPRSFRRAVQGLRARGLLLVRNSDTTGRPIRSWWTAVVIGTTNGHEPTPMGGEEEESEPRNTRRTRKGKGKGEAEGKGTGKGETKKQRNGEAEGKGTGMEGAE